MCKQDPTKILQRKSVLRHLDWIRYICVQDLEKISPRFEDHEKITKFSDLCPRSWMKRTATPPVNKFRNYLEFRGYLIEIFSNSFLISFSLVAIFLWWITLSSNEIDGKRNKGVTQMQWTKPFIHNSIDFSSISCAFRRWKSIDFLLKRQPSLDYYFRWTNLSLNLL